MWPPVIDCDGDSTEMYRAGSITVAIERCEAPLLPARSTAGSGLAFLFAVALVVTEFGGLLCLVREPRACKMRLVCGAGSRKPVPRPDGSASLA
jgi:hypothetical protein